MKKAFSLLLSILSHLVLILSLMMLTFFVIDRINPSMAFLNNTLTKYILAFFSLLSLILAIVFILREEKSRSRKETK